jgi:hypothetical protein
MRRFGRQDGEYSRRQWSEVKSLQSPAWLKQVYDKISTLGELRENWDSHGGSPVTEDAILMIRVVLSNLDIQDMPRPHVAAIPDGGIGLHWRVANRDLEIEVEPNGMIHSLKTTIGQEPIDNNVESLKDFQNMLDWALGR